MVEEFDAFNYVLKFCRPNMSNYKVFEVDAGLPTDQSIIMRAAEFDGDKMVSDPYDFIIAKLWVLENLDTILRQVPENS